MIHTTSARRQRNLWIRDMKTDGDHPNTVEGFRAGQTRGSQGFAPGTSGDWRLLPWWNGVDRNDYVPLDIRW